MCVCVGGEDLTTRRQMIKSTVITEAKKKSVARDETQQPITFHDFLISLFLSFLIGF